MFEYSFGFGYPISLISISVRVFLYFGSGVLIEVYIWILGADKIPMPNFSHDIKSYPFCHKLSRSILVTVGYVFDPPKTAHRIVGLAYNHLEKVQLVGLRSADGSTRDRFQSIEQATESSRFDGLTQRPNSSAQRAESPLDKAKLGHRPVVYIRRARRQQRGDPQIDHTHILTFG